MLAVAAFVVGAVFGVQSLQGSSADDEALEALVDTTDIGADPPGAHVVLTDPSVLAGQDIAILLVVTEIASPNSFRGAAAKGSDDSVLVVYPGVPVMRIGDSIRFTGGVRPCTKEAADRYLKTEVSEGTFQAIDDDYCVITSVVEVVQEAQV